MIGTIEAVERRLFVDGFLLRYDTATSRDGLPVGEGAFLACSFWLADAYVLLGRTDDARHLFERLLALRNDVGLLAEEIRSGSGAPGWQFPAGVLPHRAREHRSQPGAPGSQRNSGRAPDRSALIGGGLSLFVATARNPRYAAVLATVSAVILVAGWFGRPREIAEAPAPVPSETELQHLARRAERRSLEGMTRYFDGVSREAAASIARITDPGVSGIVWDERRIVLPTLDALPGSGTRTGGAGLECQPGTPRRVESEPARSRVAARGTGKLVSALASYRPTLLAGSDRLGDVGISLIARRTGGIARRRQSALVSDRQYLRGEAAFESFAP